MANDVAGEPEEPTPKAPVAARATTIAEASLEQLLAGGYRQVPNTTASATWNRPLPRVHYPKEGWSNQNRIWFGKGGFNSKPHGRGLLPNSHSLGLQLTHKALGATFSKVRSMEMETAAQKWFERVLEPFGQNAGVELDAATDGLEISGQGANGEFTRVKLGRSTFHYDGTENILIIQLGSLELEIRTPDPETRAPSPDTSSPAHG